MAILLKEVGLYEKAQLFATDIDVRSLEVAEKAHYPLRYKSLYEQNLQGVLPGVPLHRYAKEEAGQLIFDPVLLKNVRFLRHNLVSEGVFGRFDIVLCRNVLIYFTPPLQEQVVAKLVESLVEGGVLMIGTKESLFWCSSAKKLVAVNETERIYRKKA
jgi:chemotaxis protein methyltransferase CheR